MSALFKKQIIYQSRNLITIILKVLFDPVSLWCQMYPKLFELDGQVF